MTDEQLNRLLDNQFHRGHHLAMSGAIKIVHAVRDICQPHERPALDFVADRLQHLMLEVDLLNVKEKQP